MKLLSVREVAVLAGCSERHLRNLWQRKKMPPPFRLGRSIKWNDATITAWLSAGCPAVGGSPRECPILPDAAA